MAKKNCENLMEQSFYDLLVKINAGMLAGYDCIIDVFDESPESVAKRCGENGANCGKCIADYLNEYPFWKEVKNGMDNNLDRIASALELIAARLELIAAQLDPEALEKRRTAMFEQLAHELAEDPAEESAETS